MRDFLVSPILLLALLCSACTKDFYASGIKLSTGEATEITYNSAVLHGQLLSTGMIKVMTQTRFSFELSADGPMRPPYTVYLQGGLTYESGKLGVMMAVSAMLNA